MLTVELRTSGSQVGPGELTQKATPDPCSAPVFHDSGFVLYILVPRNCTPNTDTIVALRWGNGRTSRWIEVPFTALGEESRVEFEVGATRDVSVHQRGTWRSFPNTSSWTWRDGAGLLVKEGVLYLLGGWSSDAYVDDIWASRNAIDWTRLSRQPWGPRHGAGWVIHQNRLYVIGGDLYQDVWSSADGVDWTKENGQGPFGKRYTPSAVSDGSRIFFYGGQYWAPYDWCAYQPECRAIGLNDVWASNDGRDWQELTNSAPWAGRGLVHGGAFFRGRIYIVGGGLKLGLPGAAIADTIAEFSDIWSSADGSTWRKEADTLGFKPRTHFSLLSTSSGCYVSDGSVTNQPNLSNDLFFAPDCVHFEPVPDTPPLPVRHASSLAYFNGSLVILGGHRDTAGTAVWQYFPDH